MSRSKSNVVMVRRPVRISIGLILGLFFMLYTIIIALNYLNKKHISLYEVTETKIASDNRCMGIIIRTERLEKASAAGYINYYASGRERVAKDAPVYSLDENGSVYEMLTGTEKKINLTKEDIRQIRASIASFRKNYSNSRYNNVNNFKSTLDGEILELSNLSLMSNLDSALKENGEISSFRLVTAPESGIVSYYTDDYSSLKADDIVPEHFNGEYEKNYIKYNSAAQAGAVIYKLVTDDNWEIVLNLNSGQYEKLKERQEALLKEGYENPYMTIHLINGDIETSVYYSLSERQNGYFATLKMTRYMIDYIDDRFLEVELFFNSAEGLKIPNSAILEKEFFVVPLSYITQGGDSKEKGIAVEKYDENGNKFFDFQEKNIYYTETNNNDDESDDFVLIAMDGLERGDSIRNEVTKEIYTLNDTRKMEGVYNANKGYCVFRVIHKLYSNEEYSIVEPDSEYGISSYDHIIVDADTVNEQDIINK